MIVRKKLLLSLSEFLTLQVILQLITLLIYTGVIMHSGVAFFGEFVFFQALISIIALLFGYRQDIRLLITRNIIPQGVLSSPRIFITLVISAFVFGLALVGYLLDLPITLEMLVLLATGTVLALQESCLSVLFQARKVVLCFFIRLVAPISTLLLLITCNVNSPLYLAAISPVLSFAGALTATFLLTHKGQFVSSLSGSEYINRLILILKEDFYPLIAALLLLASLNLPLALTRELFGFQESGIVAVIMKFLGSPLALILTSIVLVFIRDDIRFSRLIVFGGRFARRHQWAMLCAFGAILLISSMAFVMKKNHDYFSYFCLALVVVTHSLWHSLQAYLQAIRLGLILARLVAIELLLLFLYYLYLSHSTLFLFSLFYGLLAVGLTVLLIFQVYRNRSS